MAKITERGKEASKTEELPAAELAILTEQSLVGSLGLKQSYSSFFQNLGMTLQAVAVAPTDALVVDADAYSVLYAGEENVFFLLTESKEFFRKNISSKYKGHVAEVIAEYFLRKTCSILAALDANSLEAEYCSFNGRSAAGTNFNHKNWELSFRFEYDKLSLVIGAAPVLHERLKEVSSRDKV